MIEMIKFYSAIGLVFWFVYIVMNIKDINFYLDDDSIEVFHNVSRDSFFVWLLWPLVMIIIIYVLLSTLFTPSKLG